MKAMSRITLSFLEFIMHVVYFGADIVLKILTLFVGFFSWVRVKSRLMTDWCMKKKFEIMDTVIILQE